MCTRSFFPFFWSKWEETGASIIPSYFKQFVKKSGNYSNASLKNRNVEILQCMPTLYLLRPNMEKK